jgi:TRAP-type uncharacterized transport system fused permease subunit
MTASSRRSPALSIICIVLALIFLAAAIYYWTQPTSLFASPYGIHHKHAAVAGVLTIIFLAGALMTRPRR